MARHRKSRRYYRKSGGRWSSNISEIVNQSLNFSPNATSVGVYTLCENPVQNSQTVSQVYTVKNIEFSFELQTNSDNSALYIENLVGFIMYVPQGMTITSDFAKQHPEYVMAYKFYGSPQFEANTSGVFNIRNPLSIKTRLARRLNTGDSIQLFITGFNQNTSTQMNCQLNGILRWWTKAN